MNGRGVVNSFISILCQMSGFMLSKVDLNSLRFFSPLENKNVNVCDTMRILMQAYLKLDTSEMFWARRMVLNAWAND